jgi:hypothetical protein
MRSASARADVGCVGLGDSESFRYFPNLDGSESGKDFLYVAFLVQTFEQAQGDRHESATVAKLVSSQRSFPIEDLDLGGRAELGT